MIRRSVLCALLLAAPVAAQDATTARGVMDATVYAALPAGAPLAVRPPDASQSSADIAGILSEALAGLGHPSNPGAPHQLSFRIGESPDVGAAPRSPAIELRGALGEHGNEDAEVLLRMQMRDRRAAAPRARTRLLVIEIADRAGTRYWEARVEASGAADDDVALVDALAPLVLARLGEAAYAVQLTGPSR